MGGFKKPAVTNWVVKLTGKDCILIKLPINNHSYFIAVSKPYSMGRPLINSSCFLQRLERKLLQVFCTLVCRSWIPAIYPLDFHSFYSGRPSLSVELDCTVVLASMISVKLMQFMSHWPRQPNVSAEQENLRTVVGCDRSVSEAQKLLPFALPLGISASRFSQGFFNLAQ